MREFRCRHLGYPVPATGGVGRNHREVELEANLQRVDPTHLLSSQAAEDAQGDHSCELVLGPACQGGDRNPKDEAQERLA